MFWIIALTPCEKGSYLIIENKLYLVENPLVHLISSSCWHFTTHETFHRPTHRNECPVTDHVSSSPKPSNINIGLGDFPANPSMKLESVDVKINTLESEGKCSSSHEKSTKRASQFDLQLTRSKTRLNSREYRLGFQISLTPAYRQTLPIRGMTKEY